MLKYGCFESYGGKKRGVFSLQFTNTAEEAAMALKRNSLQKRATDIHSRSEHQTGSSGSLLHLPTEGTKQKRLTRQNNNFSQTRARLNLEFFFVFTFFHYFFLPSIGTVGNGLLFRDQILDT